MGPISLRPSAQLLEDLGAQLTLAAGNNDFHMGMPLFCLIAQLAVCNVLQVLAVGLLP